MDKTELRAAALAAANKVRTALGFEPVDHLYPGVPRDGWACPITETVYDDSPELREKYVVFTSGSGIRVFDKPEGMEWRANAPQINSPYTYVGAEGEKEVSVNWQQAFDTYYNVTNDAASTPARVVEEMDGDAVDFIAAFDGGGGDWGIAQFPDLVKPNEDTT